MLLMIDNYDSFTWNLVQYLAQLGEDVVVKRNDELGVDDVERMAPDRIVVSPGPCTPKEAGISVALIQRVRGRIPLLGVCLGHQSIGAAYGAEIVRAGQLMHGKVSQITHDGAGVFAGLPNPFRATRYHSLVISEPTLPPELTITSRSEDGEIMGVRTADGMVEGVQFHPESILTESGMALLENFVRRTASSAGAGRG